MLNLITPQSLPAIEQIARMSVLCNRMQLPSVFISLQLGNSSLVCPVIHPTLSVRRSLFSGSCFQFRVRTSRFWVLGYQL